MPDTAAQSAPNDIRREAGLDPLPAIIAAGQALPHQVNLALDALADIVSVYHRNEETDDENADLVTELQPLIDNAERAMILAHDPGTSVLTEVHTIPATNEPRIAVVGNVLTSPARSFRAILKDIVDACQQAAPLFNGGDIIAELQPLIQEGDIALNSTAPGQFVTDPIQLISFVRSGTNADDAREFGCIGVIGAEPEQDAAFTKHVLGALNDSHAVLEHAAALDATLSA